MYVETVPRTGYRLICEPQPIEPAAETSRRPELALVAGTKFIAALLALVTLDRFKTSGVQSVAVLPFANLTGSPTNDTEGDVLAEAVIHSIAQQLDLRVAAELILGPDPFAPDAISINAGDSIATGIRLLPTD